MSLTFSTSLAIPKYVCNRRTTKVETKVLFYLLPSHFFYLLKRKGILYFDKTLKTQQMRSKCVIFKKLNLGGRSVFSHGESQISVAFWVSMLRGRFCRVPDEISEVKLHFFIIHNTKSQNFLEGHRIAPDGNVSPEPSLKINIDLQNLKYFWKHCVIQI